MNKDHRMIIYIALQIITTLFILFTGPWFVHNIPFLLVQAFGLLLMLWALLSKKMTTHHHPAKPIFLVTKGPYEIIRHPGYAGFLLFMSGFINGNFTLIRFLVFLVLLLVTLFKLTYEENITNEEYKEYKDYKTKTHRLVPYFY